MIASAAFGERESLVAPEDLNSSTPCDAWTVRDLVAHAVGVQRGFAGMLGAPIGDADDWPALRNAIADHLAAMSDFNATVPVPGVGEMTAAGVIDSLTYDLLIHPGDLARAIGANPTLPAELVAPCHQWLTQFPDEMMRATKRYAAKQEAPAEADAQTRMLAFAGRST